MLDPGDSDSLLTELVCCFCPEAAVLWQVECKVHAHTNTRCLCVLRDRADRSTPVNLEWKQQQSD